MPVKENLVTAKDIASKLPGLVKDFFDYSLLGFIFESRSKGLKDILIYAKYWALIWMLIVKLGFTLLVRKGPVGVVRILMKYPWLLTFLQATRLLRRLTRDRSGAYLEATGLFLYTLALCFIEHVEEIFYQSDRMIIEEDLVPPVIARAMGLFPWTPESMPLVLAMIDSKAMEIYIDEAEHAGINQDACSLPKATIGMILKDRLPGGSAIISSNMPCEAGYASYSMIKRYYDIPAFWLDAPYHIYNSERSERLFVDDLKRMIKWLEENTPGRMDWSRLKEICENRNHMMELELEIWEMIRTRPAPLAGDPIALSHLLLFNLFPHHKEPVRMYEKLVKLAKENLKSSTGALKKEKFRAVLWNAPFPDYAYIFNELERAYGIAFIIDSLSYNRLPFIDTTSPETMLSGLANMMMQGPMVRHTRGPGENYLGDIFRCYKQFNLDMVWIANNVNCKSAVAMNGILREKCRAMNIPLLILDFDVLDPRIVSHEGMTRQVDYFMENVMKAQRLDQ